MCYFFKNPGMGVSDWQCGAENALGSDHRCLTWSIVPPNGQDTAEEEEQDPGFRIDPARKNEWMGAFAERVPEALALASLDDVDRAAELLLAAFRDATAAVMPKRSSRVGLRALWWNDDCDQAIHDLKAASDADRPRARGRFRAAIRAAKRNFANKILQDATPEKVWELCRWATGNRRQSTPPIRTIDGRFAIEPQEQGAAFAAHFFPNEVPHVDPVLPDDPPPRPARAFFPITEDEARRALQETSNTTAPGESGATYRLMKWAFAARPRTFIEFFNA
ncbi:hypothetical protein EV715DRAFT_298345, partial [Schizophyllum commune]